MLKIRKAAWHFHSPRKLIISSKSRGEPSPALRNMEFPFLCALKNFHKYWKTYFSVALSQNITKQHKHYVIGIDFNFLRHKSSRYAKEGWTWLYLVDFDARRKGIFAFILRGFLAFFLQLILKWKNIRQTFLRLRLCCYSNMFSVKELYTFAGVRCCA